MTTKEELKHQEKVKKVFLKYCKEGDYNDINYTKNRLSPILDKKSRMAFLSYVTFVGCRRRPLQSEQLVGLYIKNDLK